MIIDSTEFNPRFYQAAETAGQASANVLTVVLFGSQARDEAGDRSDIDLALITQDESLFLDGNHIISGRLRTVVDYLADKALLAAGFDVGPEPGQYDLNTVSLASLADETDQLARDVLAQGRVLWFSHEFWQFAYHNPDNSISLR